MLLCYKMLQCYFMLLCTVLGAVDVTDTAQLVNGPKLVQISQFKVTCDKCEHIAV